jgi:hypothetical protein
LAHLERGHRHQLAGDDLVPHPTCLSARGVHHCIAGWRIASTRSSELRYRTCGGRQEARARTGAICKNFVNPGPTREAATLKPPSTTASAAAAAMRTMPLCAKRCFLLALTRMAPARKTAAIPRIVSRRRCCEQTLFSPSSDTSSCVCSPSTMALASVLCAIPIRGHFSLADRLSCRLKTERSDAQTLDSG